MLQTFEKLEFSVGQFQTVSKNPNKEFKKLLKFNEGFTLVIDAMLLYPEFVEKMREAGYISRADLIKRLRYAFVIGYHTLGNEMMDHLLSHPHYSMQTLITLSYYEVEGPAESVFDAQEEMLFDLVRNIAYEVRPTDPMMAAREVLNDLPIADEEFKDAIGDDVYEYIADLGPITIH
jgi:hypothetical protein